MSDICDITEVGFTGETDGFSTIGQVADVGAVTDNDLLFKLIELIDISATVSSAYTELHRQLVDVRVTAATSYFQVMTGGDAVNVSARGAVILAHRLSDLALVGATGGTTILQSPTYDLAAVSASASITALSGALVRHTVSVQAAGSVWIDGPIKQFVTVTATAAIQSIQTRWTRDLVSVGADGHGSLAGQVVRAMDMVAVLGTGSVLTYQHLDAYELASVEACVEVDILADQDAATGWSAPLRSFGMSRHRYPMNINSVAALGDAFAVAGSGGVYLLNDSAAQDILSAGLVNAYVKTALTDIGDSALKRGIGLYVSYRSGVSIGVDVGETSTGVELTWSYTSPALVNLDLRPNRIPIGKGIRSRYLRFTLRNTGGAPLTIASAEADHLSTTRRT